jgi:hypothetical protein
MKGSLPGLCYRRFTSPFHLKETLAISQRVSRTGTGEGGPEE